MSLPDLSITSGTSKKRRKTKMFETNFSEKPKDLNGYFHLNVHKNYKRTTKKNWFSEVQPVAFQRPEKASRQKRKRTRTPKEG